MSSQSLLSPGQTEGNVSYATTASVESQSHSHIFLLGGEDSCILSTIGSFDVSSNTITTGNRMCFSREQMVTAAVLSNCTPTNMPSHASTIVSTDYPTHTPPDVPTNLPSLSPTTRPTDYPTYRTTQRNNDSQNSQEIQSSNSIELIVVIVLIVIIVVQ